MGEGEKMGRDILVVDGDEELLRVLELVLGDAGYTVRVSRTAAEAAALARTQMPDLVLMDVASPLDTGLTVAEELKDHIDAYVPIIAMSSTDLLLAPGRARACFEGWLPKPFSLNTLLHFVSGAGEP